MTRPDPIRVRGDRLDAVVTAAKELAAYVPVDAFVLEPILDDVSLLIRLGIKGDDIREVLQRLRPSPSAIVEESQP